MDTYICHGIDRPLDATVIVPGSKSITNRALVLAAMAEGRTTLRGALFAEDTRLMIDALRSLGVRIKDDERGRRITVEGCAGHLPASEAKLFCGNAGTVMRFCAALVAAGYGEFELSGVERMRQRPIGELTEALRRLGAGIEFPGEEDFPPIVVHARHLCGRTLSFHSPASSQMVSAIMQVAPLARDDIMIEITGEVPSIPYLKMTARVMEAFGVSCMEQYGPDDVRIIVPAPQRLSSLDYTIEPDASNATYFLAAAGIAGGRVTVPGLSDKSIQGDARFGEVLAAMGCRFETSCDGLTCKGPKDGVLRGIDVDLNDMPDTVPTLAAVALFAQGATTIRNVASLRVKECDRISALTTELTSVGATVIEQNDGLTIMPPDKLVPATLDTYNDHRMAMSFALVGLKCEC